MSIGEAAGSFYYQSFPKEAVAGGFCACYGPFMMFFRSLKLSATRVMARCLRYVLPFSLCLTACGLDLKNGLARRNQETKSEFDSIDCGPDADPLVLDFVSLRKRLTGETPVCSVAMDELAQSQSNWLLLNADLKLSVKPHEQRAGTPGFSGATLAARMQRQNLETDQYFIAETIAQGDFSSNIWRAHLGSVLHRSILLAPGLTTFGFSQNAAATVLTAAVSVDRKQFAPVFYPIDSESVGTARLLSERPAQDLAAVGMGYPISVHFPWGCSDLSVLRFKVQHAGKDLAGKFFTKRELPNLSASELYFISTEVLPAGESIDVDAALSCGSQTFTKVWRFNTIF